MKTTLIHLSILALLTGGTAFGQAADFFTNFVRQVQIQSDLPEPVIWDVSVPPEGESLSALAINPGGARFELWTIQNDPLTVYLLDSKYVGAWVPMADVVIRTEDPYTYTGIPRTRADRPFVVDITTAGLLDGPTDPVASKSVTLLRHVQSYGPGGTGEGIDRDQAILLHQVSLTNNATHRLSYTLNSVPGADRSKVRGEERFSVFTLEDIQTDGVTTYSVPPSQLGAMRVQFWPVADGTISGLSQNQKIRFDLPQVTLTLNDLYPDSRTYAQVYEGEVRDNVQGKVVTGSALAVFGAVPESRVITLDHWNATLTDDGRWTLEVLTFTPFGVDRLAHVTFDVDRTIDVRGSFTTINE